MERLHDQCGGWLPISLAPQDRDLEVCVIDRDGVHALVFPCRRAGPDWIKATSRTLVEIHPSHYRAWRGPREK
jgi:hypothetical protein